MYYYPLHPPYFLLVAGLLAAITSGAALNGMLKLMVQEWSGDDAKNSQSHNSIKRLLYVPFLGITGGTCLFLCSGLGIFGFPSFLAYAVGVPVSLLTCLLIWLQLGSMLTFAESRGLQSLDLD